jgi:hypothetical protein
MKFLPFDLDQHLLRYNQTEETSLKRNDFEFLRALSPESIHSFTLATELLKKSSSLGIQPLMGSESNFLDNVKTQLTDKDYQGVRFSIYKLGEFIGKNDLQAWYIEQQRRLSNPDLWDQIASNPKANRVKKPLIALKNQWLSEQAQYSGHNISALWFVANNIVDFFENYYRYAELEFRQHRSKIPQALKESYETYLSNAKKSLYEFRNDLCQAMLIRLQLATASGNITYNDHVHYTANWLLNTGLISQQHGLPRSQRNDLTPHFFHQLITYIIQHGSETHKESICKLSLFACDGDYIAWRNKTSLILVPTVFYERKLVPESAPWFPRLFINRYFRYHFFEKNLWLFSSLRSLSRYPIVINRIDNVIDHLKIIEGNLNEASTEIQAKKFVGIQRLIHYKTILFTHEWSEYQREAKISLATKKIAIIHSIHQHIAAHKTIGLDYDKIKSLLYEVSEALAIIHMPQDQCEQFYFFKSELLCFLSATTSATTTDSAQSTESKNPFGERPASTEAAQTQASTNPFGERPLSTNPFDAPSELPATTDNTLIELLSNLKLMELDKDNFEEMMSSITRSMKAIYNLNSSIKQRALQNAIEKVFTHYLKKCAALNTMSDYEKYHDKFLAIEQLLVTFSADHIKTRVQAITELRQKPDYWFVFQLKCRSYLASFQVKIAPYLIANSVVLNSQQDAKQHEPTTPHESLTQ